MSIEFNNQDSRLGYLNDKLDDLLDGINASYGQSLLDELMIRLEATIDDFNKEVFEVRRSSKDKYVWPDYGDEKISLEFVNNFIKKYFKLDKKFSFSSPFFLFQSRKFLIKFQMMMMVFK